MIDKVINYYKDRPIWQLLMALSLIGLILQDGVGYYDVLFWLSVTALPINYYIKGKVIVKVVDSE